MPELLPGAAPEPRLAGLARAPLGLGVHPGEHQHAAALGVLDDRRAELALRGHQAASRGTPRVAQLVAERDEPGRVFVQDRGEERRLGDLERGGDVGGGAGAARGDHGHRDGVAELGEQLEVVAVARAVAVDRGDEQLAGAARLALARPERRCRARCRACRRASGREPFSVSIATTTAWLPSMSASSSISAGLASAAELTEILSAPASSSAVASSTERMPPPTVNGIETCSATRAATSTAEPALSIVAARRGRRARRRPPRSRRRRARPGRRRRAGSWNLTPLTTRPPATSRHGIRRGRGIARGSVQEAAAGGAALLGVELDAEERAATRRSAAIPSLVAVALRASRRRRSARTSTPRRPAPPRPSRCAARDPPAGGRRGRGRARARGRRRPPRSRRARAGGRGRCRGSGGRRRRARAGPRRGRGRAQAGHRAAAEPTPGRTARSASSSGSGSWTSTVSAPSRARASSTERTLPAP